MLITRNKTWQNGVRKKTIKADFKIGPVTLKFLTIAILAVAALFYLAQSTQTSSFKLKISSLEDQKNKTQTDIKQLEVESARLKSLNEIKANAEGLNLSEAD